MLALVCCAYTTIQLNAEPSRVGISATSFNNAGSAWRKGYTGKGVRIALFDADHRNRGVTSLLSNSVSFSDYAGAPTAVNPDIYAHSVYTSSLIVGSFGMRGVAPGAHVVIYPIDVGDPSHNMAWADVLLPPDIQVACLPFGSLRRPWSNEADAHTEADARRVAEFVQRNQHVIIVASAGNDGPDADTLNFPADQSGILSVGAVDEMYRLSAVSSRGPASPLYEQSLPHFVTLGENVLGAAPSLRALRTMSGTSAAAPILAGVLALMADASAPHRLTHSEANRLLWDSAALYADNEDYARLGLVNLTAAIEQVERLRADYLIGV